MYAFELFVSDEFDIRENSDVDEIEFIRRFKLMGMGVKSKMPTKLTAERVVVYFNKIRAEYLSRK